MVNERQRVYEIEEIQKFFVELCGCPEAPVRVGLGEVEVRMTREAFFALVGSLAQIASRLQDEGPQAQPQPLPLESAARSAWLH
jgi:hypothetical protein